MLAPSLRRLGGTCGIAGALTTLALNLAHPRGDPAADTAQQLALVAASRGWIPLHWGLAVGLLLLLPALAAVTASLRGTAGEPWSRLALLLAAIATALWVVLVAVEVTVKRLVSAADPSGPVAAGAMWALGDNVLTATIVVNWLGISLFGVALAVSGLYPRVLGATGVALGAAVVLLVGVPRALGGPSALRDAVAFPALATASLVWMAALGALLWRGPATGEGQPPARARSARRRASP